MKKILHRIATILGTIDLIFLSSITIFLVAVGIWDKINNHFDE